MANAGRKIIPILAAVLALASAAPSSAQAAASSSRAILTRGTIAVRGVPHFPSNAIGALYGEYRWDQSAVRVWIIREELFFSGEWKEYPLRTRTGAAIKAYAKSDVLEPAGAAVFAVREDGYWLLIELPAAEKNPRTFMIALVARMAYFASHTKTRSDLSLPAVLDTP